MDLFLLVLVGGGSGGVYVGQKNSFEEGVMRMDVQKDSAGNK